MIAGNARDLSKIRTFSDADRLYHGARRLNPMRLARPVYESVPLVYALIGAAAIVLAYLDPQSPRTVIALVIGLLAEIAALTVFLRRQDYRALSREYPGATLEPPPRFNA
jgi:archaellum biogenesis protein FlaJ (TadC family)